MQLIKAIDGRLTYLILGCVRFMRTQHLRAAVSDGDGLINALSFIHNVQKLSFQCDLNF